MIRYFFFLVSLAVLTPAFAGDLFETNSDFDGLPELVEFDCFPDSSSRTQYFDPLNRRMRVPKNFEQSQSDPKWINWNVQIPGENGDLHVARFASIQFGEIDTDMSWISSEFDLVSRAADNGYDVDVYLSKSTSEDFGTDRWLILLRENQFLKVIARADIDWASLLTCCE